MDIIYTPVLKLFGWNSFLNEQPDDLRGIAAEFQQSFATLGCGIAFGTLLVTTIVCVCFYYFKWCNGSSNRFKYRYRLRWWLCWMAISTICTIFGTYILEILILDNIQLGEKFIFAVTLANVIYSILCFSFFSIAAAKLRGKQTNASCTPF